MVSSTIVDGVSVQSLQVPGNYFSWANQSAERRDRLYTVFTLKLMCVMSDNQISDPHSMLKELVSELQGQKCEIASLIFRVYGRSKIRSLIMRKTASKVLGTKLKNRNKLIRIADSSEWGWETVRQYDANPLAEDSDDESRLRRAEEWAVRKIKKDHEKDPEGLIHI